FSSGVRFYFDKGKDLINKQNLDPAGLGGDVGAYLNSREKIQEAVDKFQLAYERSVKAEEYDSRGYAKDAIEMWRKVFGDYFPVYG
ncbi:MAG: nucleotidyltransferase, partial [Candidatus Omnitrophica bacterium]|nr:nucleotidyltransferase [Candidatus Omnitrophota bacterium]